MSAILGTLPRYGEVVDLRVQEDVLRQILVRLAVPGYDLPLEGSMVFIERFRRSRDGWELALYEYDYHREPKPSGRKAYHRHDGSYHIHCVDPRRLGGAGHFRGFPIDLLEAAREFAEIHAGGAVSCAGLHPLVP